MRKYSNKGEITKNKTFILYFFIISKRFVYSASSLRLGDSYPGLSSEIIFLNWGWSATLNGRYFFLDNITTKFIIVQSLASFCPKF